MRELNNRLLLIDDDDIARQSFRDMLTPKRADTSSLDVAASVLFDEPDPDTVEAPPPSSVFRCFLDEAPTGKEGFEMVRQAAQNGLPYAAIFLDMRMPGWDGLETAQQIRCVDDEAQLVFVTAYADHSIDEVVQKAGTNVGYHCKPFVADEVRQLAQKSIHDWNQLRSLERLVRAISGLGSGPGVAMKGTVTRVLEEVAVWIGASAAVLHHQVSGDDFERIEAVGATLEPSATSGANLRRALDTGDPAACGPYLVFPVGSGNVIVAATDEAPEPALLERMRGFLQHAGAALENARLRASAVRAAEVAAVERAARTARDRTRAPLATIRAVARAATVAPAQIAASSTEIAAAADAIDGALANLDVDQGRSGTDDVS